MTEGNKNCGEIFRIILRPFPIRLASRINLSWMQLIDAVRSRNLASAVKVFAAPASVSLVVLFRVFRHFLKIPLYPQGRDEGRGAAALRAQGGG